MDSENWVVRPDEVHIDIRVGSEAAQTLSGDVREKLDALLESIKTQQAKSGPNFRCAEVWAGDCDTLIICGGVQGW